MADRDDGRLAPVGISTYARLEHFRQTVTALAGNTLASRSDLYVFSDAPRPGDEDNVEAVREYASTIDGFRSVTVVARLENSRVLNNRGAVDEMLEQHGRMIFMEEDVVTAPGFLAFMNEALGAYESDSRVLAVSGFCPPGIVPNEFGGDVFAMPRFSGWGYATWRDRFDPFGFALDPDEMAAFFGSRREMQVFRAGGDDLLEKLWSEWVGEIDALDVRLHWHQFRHGLVTVYPRVSLTQNIGHDGTGLHTRPTDRFHHEALWDKDEAFHFDTPVVDERIMEANRRFRRMGMRERLRFWLRSRPVYRSLKERMSR